MELYNRVRSVPDGAKKPFDTGKFKGTDITPQWRLEVLTREFGPAGVGFYFDNVRFWNELTGSDILVYCECDLFIKVNGEWSKPIHGIGGNKTMSVSAKDGRMNISDEGYKMAYTDAISVACKTLGIGADVYFEKSESKYKEFYTEQQPRQVIVLQNSDDADAWADYCIQNKINAARLNDQYDADFETLMAIQDRIDYKTK